MALRATLVRYGRSVWKGPFADPLQHMGGDTYRGTRRSMILPEWIGKTVEVHNGRKWISVNLQEDMIGHRLGEFALTRTKGQHKGEVMRKKQEAAKARSKK